MGRAQIVRDLGVTPRRVRALVDGLAGDLARRRPQATEWSMLEIVNHLLVGERDVILPRLQRMRAEDAPVFPSAVAGPDAPSDPAGLDLEATLRGFDAVRNETLAFLAGLTDAEWRRVGTTRTRGTLTIEAYADFLAGHDAEHLQQLEATRAAVAR